MASPCMVEKAMFFNSFKDRTVIITGAAGGIGTPLTHLCEKMGMDLLLLDCHAGRLGTLTDSLKPTSQFAAETSELLSYSECKRLIKCAPSPPIALVHLAGVFEPDPDDNGDYHVWNRAFDHNLKNARNMCLAFEEAVPDSELGRIVLTSSLAANRGAFDHYSYTAAKAGLLGLTRAFSKRFAPRIVVNCVCPGIILTGMPDRVLADRRERVLSEIPLKRFGEPEEVANVIMFLISDAVSYVSGQSVNIDGGTISD